MTETFEEPLDDSDGFDEEVTTRRRGRKVDDIPDGPVENAADIPLLVHAGTGKANTITYLKVIRLDGDRSEMGLKGTLSPDSTAETIAQRFGNGVYKIEGCNYRHKVLAREELSISIPGYAEQSRQPHAPVVAGVDQRAQAQAQAHSMNLLSNMAIRYGDTVKDQSIASAQNVKDMASSSMQMLTEFTTAQRESERAAHQASVQNQQQFFASMMNMQQQAHRQQMELLTAMHERQRASEQDPMAMVKLFTEGMKMAGELGGDGPDPMTAALREGSSMLGSLATIAGAGHPTTMPAAPTAPQAQHMRTLPTTTVQRAPRPSETAKGRKIPFAKSEVREIARLRAILRRRGISLEQFLSQSTEYYETAPDEDLYESENDGPQTSEHNGRPEHEAEEETPETDVLG